MCQLFQLPDTGDPLVHKFAALHLLVSDPSNHGEHYSTGTPVPNPLRLYPCMGQRALECKGHSPFD